MKALSIRAPWWWFILHGGKDIENRKWRTEYRGTVLVHAAKTVPLRDTQDDLESALEIMWRSGRYPMPAPTLTDFLQAETRGAIVGKVDIDDCISDSGSPWFFGRYGFVLRNPIAFSRAIPFKGELGFFEVPDELVRAAA